MSRSDQVIGLNSRAEKLIEGEQVLQYIEHVTRVSPDGRKEELGPNEVYGSSVLCEESGDTFTGMFKNNYPLMKYTFPDGRILFEKVQAEPWSSGPMFFLALKDEQGKWVKKSLWTEKEMMEY